MINLLLELKIKYPNDQEFGRKVRQILDDEKIFEIQNTLNTKVIIEPEVNCSYYRNKRNDLLHELKEKYTNE